MILTTQYGSIDPDSATQLLQIRNDWLRRRQDSSQTMSWTVVLAI